MGVGEYYRPNGAFDTGNQIARLKPPVQHHINKN